MYTSSVKVFTQSEQKMPKCLRLVVPTDELGWVPKLASLASPITFRPLVRRLFGPQRGALVFRAALAHAREDFAFSASRRLFHAGDPTSAFPAADVAVGFKIG